MSCAVTSERPARAAAESSKIALENRCIDDDEPLLLLLLKLLPPEVGAVAAVAPPIAYDEEDAECDGEWPPPPPPPALAAPPRTPPFSFCCCCGGRGGNWRVNRTVWAATVAAKSHIERTTFRSCDSIGHVGGGSASNANTSARDEGCEYAEEEEEEEAEGPPRRVRRPTAPSNSVQISATERAEAAPSLALLLSGPNAAKIASIRPAMPPSSLLLLFAFCSLPAEEVVAIGSSSAIVATMTGVRRRRSSAARTSAVLEGSSS